MQQGPIDPEQLAGPDSQTRNALGPLPREQLSACQLPHWRVAVKLCSVGLHRAPPVVIVSGLLLSGPQNRDKMAAAVGQQKCSCLIQQSNNKLQRCLTAADLDWRIVFCEPVLTFPPFRRAVVRPVELGSSSALASRRNVQVI